MPDRPPIDFMGSQFIVLDGFERVRRRHVVRVIRGCGGSIASWTSNKKAPLRILVGDGFFPPTSSTGTALEVDGVHLGSVSQRASELIDLSRARVCREDEIIASTGLGMGPNERMSVLRGALQGEPSREAWSHAVAVLEAWPHDQGPDDAIRYAIDLTRDWPADVCVSSRRWIKRSRQVCAPKMRLVKTLEGRVGDDTRDVCRALDGAPRLEAVTFRNPGDLAFSPYLMRNVLGHAASRRVRTITLDFSMWWSQRASFHDALFEAELPALEEIRVGPRLQRFAFFDQEQTLGLLGRDPPVAFLDLDGEPIWRDDVLDAVRAARSQGEGEGA